MLRFDSRISSASSVMVAPCVIRRAKFIPVCRRERQGKLNFAAAELRHWHNSASAAIRTEPA